MCVLIRSHQVETLYPDTLQFLYHLALSILVGGGIVVLAARPAEIRGWDGLAMLCVVLVVITSVLKAGAFEVSGAPEARLVARWVALALTSAAVIYASGWAGPVARTLRTQTRDFDDLPASAPARRESVSLARSASRALGIAVIAGLVAMYLS
jgi:hypothetical protein